MSANSSCQSQKNTNTPVYVSGHSENNTDCCNNKPANGVSVRLSQTKTFSCLSANNDNIMSSKEKTSTITAISHQSDSMDYCNNKTVNNLSEDFNRPKEKTATIGSRPDKDYNKTTTTMIFCQSEAEGFKKPKEKTSANSRQSDNIDCSNNSRSNEKRARRRKQTSFTQALKEKYCVEDNPAFDFIIVSPKRKTNNSAELAHLQTVVLNDMGITRADIPKQGLVSLCPNVVDLDLSNNLLETWSELLSILSHLPKVRYLNVSRNKLNLDLANASESLQNQKLSVENLALNDTGTTIEEAVKLAQLMPVLKELHLCDNNYEDLADIDDCVKNGALSCLECLRLNNNEITRWSEVWKLCYLPFLKCLVLSGNPISNVFYHCVDRTNNNSTKATDLYSRADNCSAADISQKTSVIGSSDTDVREKCLQCEFADSNMDMNCECEGVLVDNFVQGDSGMTQEAFHDIIRPVSHMAFHTESNMSIGSCAIQQSVSRSECDSFILSNQSDRNILFQNMQPGINSSNVNNSCQGNVQKCLCEGYDVFDGGFLLNDEVFENGNVDGDDNIESDDWHRVVAEEFLHEIIDGITFDDLSDQRVLQFQPASCDQTLTASDSLEESGSNSDSISDVNITCSIESSTTEQLSAERASFEASVLDSDLAVSVQENGFNYDFSPMSLDIDAQFIPRAVRLFDDDFKNSFFYMATPSPPRSRAQRCLFQEPVCNGHSQSDESEDTRDGSHQSASDSCSDCEAEQFKHEKQTTTDIGSAPPCSAPGTPSQPKLEGNTVHRNSLSQNVAPETSVSFLATDNLSHPNHIKECTQNNSSSQPIKANLNNEPIRENAQILASDPNCKSCSDGQNLESNNNNVSEQSGHNHHCDHICPHMRTEPRPAPFQHLQVLCLSSANLHHWNHLTAFTAFPKLTNLRLKNNPLYSSVSPEDRRKLYIASLPKVSVLNGSEVSHTEREKAERHYLRYFMDKEDKPDCYYTLVKKHGPPVKLVDIDLSAGYQEWANLKFVCKGVEEFSRKIHLVEPVCKLRILISQVMRLPRRCFVMYHFSCGPSHPESERELVELRCESLPMSRFDFADGDEIHIDFQD